MSHHFIIAFSSFCHFQVQARKRGVFGWWWCSGQNETQSGQSKTHLGNLYNKWAELGGKFNHPMGVYASQRQFFYADSRSVKGDETTLNLHLECLDKYVK